LTDAGAADIGWSKVSLQQLHGDSAQRELAGAGVDVQLRSRVETVEPHGSGWLVRAGTDEHATDAVVVALPPDAAERVIPADALDLAAGWSRELGSSPILNVHAVFDRTVMDEEFLACVGSPLQWLFDRNAPSGLRTGQYLAASVSAADDLADRPVGEIRSLLLPEFERVLPRARSADVLDFFVTREQNATFRQAPGSGRWRPPATTRLPGLVLAGAHTLTGWPATMEGAVRSGDTAAAIVSGTVRQHTGEGVAA
jgi:hypothetical protein